MQPHKSSLFELFEGKKRYVVPLFQRQYVWRREEQWELLWEDIQRKYLDKLDRKEGPPHFLGAMVIEQRKTSGTEVPAHLVIDGQQRLTTFQIFLAAFRDVCAAIGEKEFEEECQGHLNNQGVMFNRDEERYKVWPTNLDRDQFRDIIDSRSQLNLEQKYPPIREKYARKAKPRPLMVECYLFFYNQLKELLEIEQQEVSTYAKVSCLFEALRNALQVVVIQLEGDDDPQVIFETLNARGEPLMPSDLLRNFIFLRAAQNGEPQEELYNIFWLTFDEPFWRKEEKQGSLNRPRSDIFLQHYLAMKRREEINIGQLYAEYKYWITLKRPFQTVREELAEMERYRCYFKQLIDPEKRTNFGKFTRALEVFNIRTVYPLALDLLSRELPPEIGNEIFTDLESYIVRRAICNFTTKHYNRIFIAILNKLPSDGLTREQFRKVLLEQRGEGIKSSKWPSDDEFQKAWMENNVYEVLSPIRVQWMLKQIEENLRLANSDGAEVESSLYTELILPQEWTTNWPLSNGSPGLRWFERMGETEEKMEVAASAARDQLKQTFGNLTLLTHPLDAEISTATFDKKRIEILNDSDIILNRYFQEVTTWDEEKIQERSLKLFEIARQIWPYGN